MDIQIGDTCFLAKPHIHSDIPQGKVERIVCFKNGNIRQITINKGRCGLETERFYITKKELEEFSFKKETA